MKSKVRMLEFVNTPRDLRQVESDINLRVKESYPEVGPVKLLLTEDGQVGVRLTMTVAPGRKAVLDEVYQFVMKQLGLLRGRTPGEKKIQAKYRISEELHRRVQNEAKKAHVTASDLVASCLRDRFR